MTIRKINSIVFVQGLSLFAAKSTKLIPLFSFKCPNYIVAVSAETNDARLKSETILRIVFKRKKERIISFD